MTRTMDKGRTSVPPRLLVFGGTTEGREIALWAAARGARVTACSATVYGGIVLGDHERIEALTRPLGHDGMRELMREGGFACVVDATHPYATTITEHVREAAGECGLPYLRLIREGEPEGDWAACADAHEAAALAARVEGRILTTTGSKELGVFTAAIPDFMERLYVRILPVESSLAQATALGIPTSHIIAMQGPFSAELNRALIRELDIACLVTKASGNAGGFWEKVEAARECGTELIVISRPTVEEGLGFEEAKERLVEDFGL